MRSKNPSRPDRFSHRAWRGAAPPRSVLLIRLHALGDVAIVLPLAGSIAREWPGARIDMLTAPPADSIARLARAISNVYVYEVAPSRLARIVDAFTYGLAVRRMRYDAIIDIQSNYITRIIRWSSGVRSWSEFDRFSPLSAAERARRSLAACGVPRPAFDIPAKIREESLKEARMRLRAAGWDGSTRLAVFNPAGLWVTRNWPLENYVELYRLWSKREPLRVLMLGTDRIRESSRAIAQACGNDIINLAAQTSAGEAFALLRLADVIITEDSGLMHMAWSAGTPVVALFGSTNSAWSSPPGDRAVCLDSSDLPCGCCMEPRCAFGDVRCLARRAPGEVLGAALGLIERVHAHTQTAPG
ncbi:MAG TPA: glycosyltransferase family 9 protein [Bacteroidota bacterium]|nr:glycosyltransferase family 9 protein [Bacteroidota bacterium]